MIIRITRKTALLAALLIFSTALSYGIEKEKKVLIIGIDGVRPDALLAASTPHMDALWQNGAYSFQARTDKISSSGPCWTAMLTGVWHLKHKVLTNDYLNPDLKHYPHFFHRLQKEKPGLQCYSVANWDPIHKILQEGDAMLSATATNDVNVTKKVVELLEKEEIDVMFVQLDEVDGAGHRHDYSVDSPKYLKAIERSDKQVGQMVEALKRRPDYHSEDWLILVSTDHGGSNFGHGKDIPDHTTIFYLAWGQSVALGEIEKEVGVVDVAVTALKHMGITAKDSWYLDGQVSGLIE
jgi:predicted AlkP superfamily pyrophosphatase or phosphodiesterase